jgi:MbeB-like, N-term conserved region.
MSSLLKLAKDLEQKSNAQAHDTEQMLKHAFSEHEKSVVTALSLSEKKISDAINAHTAGMNTALQSHRLNVLRMVGRTWLTLTLVSFLLVGTCGSVLWWQGSRIVSNQNELARQEDALSKLTARTWGVTYQEDQNGRFLVLPSGTKADVGWKVEKRQAVKLVKE